jgi:hypothetical protein
MKKIILLLVITILSFASYLIYQDICKSSPECSCKNAAPGDATCLSPSQLSDWCHEQKSPLDLPQCNLGEANYPFGTIIQLIIDHKQLQSFYHPELKERVPLILRDNLIDSDLVLKKFGKAVKIVSNKDIKGPFIRFTKFDCQQDNHCDVTNELFSHT